MKKTAFLFSGPHPVHAEWAEQLDAEFVSNKIQSTKLDVWLAGRFIKSFSVQKNIPKDTDLLLCESGSELIAGAIWKKNNPRKKLALIVDDPKLFFLSTMNPLLKKIYLWALDYFDLLIPTTNLMLEAIPQKFRSKARIAPMYAKTGYFCEKQTNLKQKNIVFVGLVGEEKGVDRIIECFRLVGKNFPESRLIIVGEGKKRKLFESWKTRNVEFAGFQKDPRKFLLQGSIYINLARIEPAGIAIIEAMCCGLVPIVSENVGFKEVVQKISKQLVVLSPEEAAEQINLLWNDKVLLKSLSKKARTEAGKITREKSINAFLKAMKEVV